VNLNSYSVIKILLIIFCFAFFIECKSGLGVSQTTNNDNSSLEKSNDNAQKSWFTGDLKGFSDKVYVENIKTVIIHKTGLELNEPVILLNSQESITLHFDDLEGYLKDYSYNLVHCTKDWEDSGLTETEYIQGFFINPITNYKVSFNTYQKFIHYQLSLPNEDVKILRSGNYVLKVFLTGYPDEIVFTRRFMVYENKSEIKPTVKRPSDLNERYFKQEIDFSLIPTGIATNNTFDIYIRQNSRWDNMKTGFQPVFYRDNEIIYDLDQPDIFNGGNEFRYFDIRSVTYTTERVIKVEKTDSLFESYLAPDYSRGFKKYLTYQDIDGKFLIENQLSPDDEHHSEADYIWVNFTLMSDKPITEGTVYIFGALSDWSFLPEFRLNYDDSLKCYQKRILLKQGYYNYEYVLLKDNIPAASETELEGDHFETENSYSIFLYFRDITNNYDRLIGYKPFSSINF